MSTLTYDASLRFGGIVRDVIRDVRVDIASLAHPKLKTTWLTGSLRALRTLLETGLEDTCLEEAELESWRDAVEAWRKKKRKHDPKDATIEEDLQALRKFAAKMPHKDWRKEAEERTIVLRIRDQATIDAALATAERDHSVKLGNALHEHLTAIVEALSANAGVSRTARSS
jgi:hypothetical protein